MGQEFAQVNGAQFYYEQIGRGPDLVLVHAGIADSRMWEDQFQALAGAFHVVRYDRRGFGRTVMVAGVYAHFQDLAALLDDLQIERAVLIGCSQGAKTILDFTLQYPERTAALVLVAPALSGFQFDGEAPWQAEEIDKAEQAGDLERVNELELQIWVDGPKRSPAEVDLGMRERVRAMNRIALGTPEGLGLEQPLIPPAADRLSEVLAPTLVIVGDLDTPRTLAAAEFLAAGIRGAQLELVSGTAHLPNMEKPEEFNRRVLAFLNSLVS
jgi:pimeloyl-ACP methyl ester carboxylesterase